MPPGFAFINVAQFASGTVGALSLLCVGKALDWVSRWRAERKQGALAHHADERAEEIADFARAKQLSDGWHEWGKMKEAEAAAVKAERDAAVKNLEERLASMEAAMAGLRSDLQEKDGLIAAQQVKIARLERQVEQLQRSERATHHTPSQEER